MQTHSNSGVNLSSGSLYIGNIPNSLTEYPQVAVVKGFNGCIDTVSLMHMIAHNLHYKNRLSIKNNYCSAHTHLSLSNQISELHLLHAS